MRFEFDAAKSAANKAKHGIDFREAQALWSDPDRIEGPGRSTDQPRFQIVGQISETTWTATVTYRHEETIRIISVRRARRTRKSSTKKDQAKSVTAEEFDLLADLPVDDPAGDMTPYVDWSKARRPGREVQRVNVDFPVDLLRSIDREARRIGVTRQAFIKLRMSDTLTNT
jgi:uncharacterized DUF497 family protein